MRNIVLLCLMSLFLSGCAVAPERCVFGAGDQAQLQLRQMQTRYFDTDNKKMMMESSIATLQDFGFVLDRVSFDLGTITATKFETREGMLQNMQMTVTIIPRSGARMVVRANARLNVKAIEEPQAYQLFFNALSQSVFLQAHLDE